MSKDQATIVKKGAYAVELEEGKNYAWCSCGLSQKQPFCDGAHSGTDFKPIVFKCEESKTAYLCGCKHSQKGQFCDGSHKDL